MKKYAISILSAYAAVVGTAAITPMFWATVAPKGVALCNSKTEFTYSPLDEAGHQAGIKAKQSFCGVVLGTVAQ